MHDDFDFACGLLQTAQIGNLVIGAVVLCNDHGDRHFSLDPICDKQIGAYYLALRFELGGEGILNDFEAVEQIENGVVLSFRNALIPILIGRRAFGSYCPEIRLVSERDMVALDVVWRSAERAVTIRLDDGIKAFTAFGTGIFRPEERENLKTVLGKISEKEGVITYDSGYSVHTVEYPERIGSYKELSSRMTSYERHCVKPSRHVWRVPSREDFGES